MRKFLGILAAAGLVTFGAVTTASAQDVSVRIGAPGYGPRHHVVREVYGRPAYRGHVVERRVMRRPVRTVCRTVMRTHMRPNGVVVRRPVEECRRVYAGGRRVYVD